MFSKRLILAEARILFGIRSRSTLLVKDMDCPKLECIDNVLPFEQLPGPKPLPFLGNRWRFMPLVGSYSTTRLDVTLKRLYKEFGPLVRISKMMSRGDMILVYDASDIETVMRSQDHRPDRPLQRIISYYKKEIKGDYFGENAGLVGVDVDSWLRTRPKVQKDILQPRISKLYIGRIEETTEKFVSKIASIRNHQQEVPPNFIHEITKWALECSGIVALDTKFGALESKMPKRAEEFIKANSTILYHLAYLDLKVPFKIAVHTPLWTHMLGAFNKFQSIIDECVQDAIARGVGTKPKNEWSLLERLLESNKDEPKVAIAMAIDLMLVGIDTTSSTVLSILYMLSKHPEVQEKIHQEVSRILPTPDSEMTAEKLEEIPYLKAAIKEVLRLYAPTLVNARVLGDDLVLRGYRIPKGTLAMLNTSFCARSEKHYDQSEKFIPERWLKHDSECPYTKTNSNLPEKFHPFSYIPFGFGSRMCIGKRFADMFIQIAICKLVQKYRVGYEYGDLGYVTAPVYTLNGPLKFKFAERQ